MKPQARIQATIDILSRTETSRVPLDSVVGDYMRQRRYIGSKDRSDIAARVYEVTRAHARLGWWLEQNKLTDTPRSRVLAYVVLGEGADLKRVKDLFDGSKYSPDELNEEELAFINALEGQAINHPEMPEPIRVECPPQYEQSLKAYFGEDLETEMTAFLTGATLDIRTNAFITDRDSLAAHLKECGIETDPTPYSPWGLRARDKAHLAKTKLFAKGWGDIQDEGSQLIAHICEAQPGMQVLDYCAGGGGKTLALAAAMERKGRIVAMDNDERRLQKGRQRYKKAQVADMIEVRPLSEKRHVKWLKRQDGKFDITLCDVPCTGTGTWRRNPDMRWNTYGPSLEDLLPVQADILDRVAHTVKPGGRLVYATCSILPEENENQIEAFLSRHEGWEVLPLDKALGRNGDYMRLTPHRHNTDGFFAAVLIRKEA